MSRFADLSDAVIDASALVDSLLQPDPGAQLTRLMARDEVVLHAPMLGEVEVVAAVRYALLRGYLSDPAAARSVVQDLVDLPVQWYPHQGLLLRSIELHANFTTHDAVYVALAETLDIPLVTGDRRLANATRAHTHVDVIEVTN